MGWWWKTRARWWPVRGRCSWHDGSWRLRRKHLRWHHWRWRWPKSPVDGKRNGIRAIGTVRSLSKVVIVGIDVGVHVSRLILIVILLWSHAANWLQLRIMIVSLDLDCSIVVQDRVVSHIQWLIVELSAIVFRVLSGCHVTTVVICVPVAITVVG